ncbi:MAG: hypothetical protein ABIH25_02390 [Candidatus Woesearchaeota archaeon]
MSETGSGAGYIETETKRIKLSKYYMIERFDVGLMSLRLSTAPEFLCFGLKYVVEINGAKKEFRKSKRKEAFESFNKEKRRIKRSIEGMVK